jgi:arylsulfatase A-like enzyme
VQFSRRQFLTAPAAPLLLGASKPPNILFIFTDDHHYQCFGAAGNPHIRTPNMDRLAARGVHFTNAVVSTSQCAPSRGVILSGRESYQTGLRSNGATSYSGDAGPAVVEQLRRGGYETSVIGKWHVRHRPWECGFASAPLWLDGGSSRYLNPVLRRDTAPPVQEQGHITTLLTDEAVRFVQSERRQPYFLWLAYNAPHSPWHADDKTLSQYPTPQPPPRHVPGGKPFDWRTYYAVITELDTAIGRVLEAVDWSNTVVFFMGDNGFLCGAKGLGGKVHPWDESVRVPCAVAGAGVRAGIRIDQPVASIDFPRTWLDLAGITSSKPLSGRSLRRVLTTGAGAPDEAFVAWDDGRIEALSVRQAVEPYRQVRTTRHKLIVWESKRQAAFDHVTDPAEEQNFIADTKYASVVDELRRRLKRRMTETNDRALAWL